MPQISFSRKSSDRIRLLKDRLARYAVTAGGISVLGALVLIFVYLAWVAIPLFSQATLKVDERRLAVPSDQPLLMMADEYGQQVFLLDKSGKTATIPLNSKTEPYTLGTLPLIPKSSYQSSDKKWFLAIDVKGQAVLGQPQFDSGQSQHRSPQIEQIALSQTLIPLFKKAQWLRFTVQDKQVILAIYDTDGELHWITQSRVHGQAPTVTEQMSKPIAGVDALLMTPQGDRLYVLVENQELLILGRTNGHILAREVVDVTAHQKNKVKSIHFLPGAHSLLISHENGDVWQWFDVPKERKRQFTAIRQFALGSGVDFILPNVYSKGFFAFYDNGTVQSHFTTSDKLVLFQRAYRKAPQLAVLASNERKLMTYRSGYLQTATVDLGYPEVSFSALWQQVWYENYPEPEYVWQSTSASDTFEAKFSLIPIAFGTIKAAAFAMLFSVPVAILAAIYTAYFMTPSMRRVVKPTIELMEALPTVIIGFLAGLWFAPIVERHLVSAVLMIVALPVSTMVAGALWRLLPKRYRQWSKQGWHALILLPMLVLVMAVVLPLSFDIEQGLFGGDIRVFLADYGINFDQRNALVVGLAMGFAVIPTIFTIAEDAVFSVPKHLSDGSMALGATQWQTLKHVVLQTASPGIFSAIMMGLGRAVGETMIVLMATGNTPILNWNILEGMRSLAATIAVELPESEVGSSHYRILFLAALILFLFTFLVNSFAEWLRLRLREKYRAL